MQNALFLLIQFILFILIRIDPGDGFSKQSVNAVSGQSSKRLCVQRLPKTLQLLNTVQKEALCSATDTDSSARCVVSASKHNSLKFHLEHSDTIMQDVVVSFLVQLCAHASSSGPAKCLNKIPAYILSKSQTTQLLNAQLNWTGSLCGGAMDDKPAGCIVELHRISGQRLIFGRDSGIQHQKSQPAKALGICRAFDGELSLFTKCVKSAPRTLELWTRFELCREGAVYSGVIGCASKLVIKGFPNAFIPQICASSSMQTYKQTTRCILTAQQKLGWMEVALQARLCANALRLNPVDCAIALRKGRTNKLGTGFGVSEIVEICLDDTDSALVLHCMERMHTTSLNAIERLRLCKTNSHVKMEYSSYCIISALQILDKAFPEAFHQTHAIQLCRDAISLAPVQCIKYLIKRRYLTITQIATLCNQAMSDHREKCYEFIHGLGTFTSEQGIKFCVGVISEGPTDCLKTHMKLTSASTFNQFGLLLCENASSEAPAICFDATSPKYSKIEKCALCNGASSVEPAKCASVTITRISQAYQAALCNKASSIAPALCALEAPYKLFSEDTVKLCRGALDIIPAKCAIILSTNSFVSSSVVVQTCQNVTSTTPAKCLLFSVSKRTALCPRMISYCREAYSIPTSLAVINVIHTCAIISSDCPLTFLVQAFDQYGDLVGSLNSGVVRLFVVRNTSTLPIFDIRNSIGLQGYSQANFVNGTANFSDFRFKKAGSFTLHFRSKEVRKGSKGEAVIRVNVHPSKHEAESTRCQIWLAKARGYNHRMEVEENGPGQEVISLALPIHMYFQVLYCEKYLSESMGLKHITNTFRFALYGRVRYRHVTRECDRLDFSIIRQRWQ